MKTLYPCFFLLCLLASCSRLPLTETNEGPLRRLPDSRIPDWNDDLPLAPLVAGLEQQIALLKKRPPSSLTFGEESFSWEEYTQSLGFLKNLLQKGGEMADLWKQIKEHFAFYEVYGREDWGEVFLTAYYGPLIPGRRQKEGSYTTPLYDLPDDLVEIHLEKWPSLSNEAPSRTYGRLIASKTTAAPSVVPYYSREEIDDGKILEGRVPVWCWVKPTDAFLMHIQGHGTVEFPDGNSMALNYAGQNGHSYVAIGRELSFLASPETMSLEIIENHLESLTPRERQNLFNKNPSYVFFRKMPKEKVGLTTMGLPAVAGRTIATDARFFPKGTVGLLLFEKPVFLESDKKDPPSWRPVSRLVLDQDTGGAIRGGGRVDLFWGKGDRAKRHAGHMRGRGKLFYLAPRKK